MNPVVREAAVAALAQRGPSAADAGAAASERQHALLLRDLEVGFGRAAVFSAGVALARVDGHPLIDALAASAGPYELAHRFMRVERLFHVGHRTSFTIEPGAVFVDHSAALGSDPIAAESLFLCGAMCGMFERVRALELTAAVVDHRGRDIEVWPAFAVRDDAALRRPLRWALRWCNDDATGSSVATTPTDRLRLAVAARPSLPWTLRAAAHELGTSTRTLQRWHRRAGTTTQSVISEGRLDAATALLLRTALPCTDIALVCGFVDLPHLTRHFRARHGIPPGRFRRRAEVASSDGPTGSALPGR